ncbi:polyprenyl synthetase family protein [Neisseria sp. Ec49-e6-T10]|uniref:polyprenyl synthetase family protein n=1 Tax=Neisseria sp. Ec49-e6-T10 TaxID=3140744 RepID=UPI003EBEB37C
MISSNDFNQWQTRAQAQTELILNRVLPTAQQEPIYLHEAMRYVTLDGGKRLRPLLVFASAALGQADHDFAELCAAAIECIHVYSLVHDDMPAMDNDSLRRGKPTCHIAYNEATALLVGDALQTLAFDLVSRPSQLPTETQLHIIQTLAHASGSLGMAGGQAIDLAHVGKPMSQAQLENMHQLKTGALIKAAIRMGALCCTDMTSAQLAQLNDYAQYLGLAFQVVDDVLDCEQDSATLGKTAGKDAQQNKPTYVSLMGLDQAKTYAQELIDGAINSLISFDEHADLLRSLAYYVIKRQA